MTGTPKMGTIGTIQHPKKSFLPGSRPRQEKKRAGGNKATPRPMTEKQRKAIPTNGTIRRKSDRQTRTHGSTERNQKTKTDETAKNKTPIKVQPKGDQSSESRRKGREARQITLKSTRTANSGSKNKVDPPRGTMKAESGLSVKSAQNQHLPRNTSKNRRPSPGIFKDIDKLYQATPRPIQTSWKRRRRLASP